MRTDADPDQALAAALTSALGSVHAAPSAGNDSTSPLRVAIAYSGGADSTALLHAAATRAGGDIAVHAFHVHHGLAATADAWLVHCRDQAAALAVPFDAEQVAPSSRGVSLEADARRLRYAALLRLCARHRCS